MAVKWHKSDGDYWAGTLPASSVSLFVWGTNSVGCYAASCNPVFSKELIRADTIEEAKSAAVYMLRERLNELIKELEVPNG